MLTQLTFNVSGHTRMQNAQSISGYIPESGHYIRIRRLYGMEYNFRKESSIIESSKILLEGIPIIREIKIDKDNRDMHDNFGHFTFVKGMSLYKNMIVTLGSMEYRDQYFSALEFLTNLSVDVKSEAENFIKDVSSKIGYKGKDLYKIGAVYNINDYWRALK